MRLFDSVVATLGLSQPVQRLVREVLMLLVIAPGRATFLNLSRYNRYDEKTFRRGFRREVHWAALNVAAIRAVAPAHHEHVLAFDTDQLLDYLCVGGLQLQEFSEELFHKRPYGAMKPFFEQLEALPDPLVPYLQNQYTEFFKLSPKQQKKGGERLGTGPWALEVGALSVLYGWDDTALRSCARYPADLVDYARERMARSAEATNSADL